MGTGAPVKYTHFTWADTNLKVLKAKNGSSDYQTSFEYLTPFIVAVTFDSVLASTGARIRGDNLGALNDALSLRSTAPGMNSIASELGWRRIVSKCQYRLKHLPTERNDEADALSRLSAVPPRPYPEAALESGVFVNPPSQDSRLWRVRLTLYLSIALSNESK